nr:immunoglobulin light chain junction region [Macaca mulatta]MOX77608.1 immunoglobulin light chain junction region [Macaca mulatta]MOX77890.1 immunoglobulin light chain junction region [Macaca mulatta]MOX77906.1 immunoglobulin light chain junction region [Macaca mulatta]MOX77910.1 immunoglobulin light chain junction region [Macaca mulatta]
DYYCQSHDSGQSYDSSLSAHVLF